MERDPIIFSTSTLQLPPGFRFHPSDEELIVHYLQNKVTSLPLPAQLITEINLYKYNPWELPKKALFGEEEWYFFSPRDRKYPNGVRPNRAAASGYWKAAGSDKPIFTSCGSKPIGVKKALVFYTGRAPKGVKTEWMMNEYRLLGSTTKPSRSKGSMRLDDWVLCRVQHKGNTSKNICYTQDSSSPEFGRCLPKVEQTQPTYTKHHPDMIKDFLHKDCQLLASILAGQAPSPIETISGVSFQGSKDGYSVASNNKVNSPISISSLGIYPNMLKRKTRDENTKETLFQLNNNLESKNKDEDLLPSKRLAGNDINYYIPNYFQNDILKPIPTFTNNFEDFNEMPFACRYFE